MALHFTNLEIRPSRGDVKKPEERLILNERCINAMRLKNRQKQNTTRTHFTSLFFYLTNRYTI